MKKKKKFSNKPVQKHSNLNKIIYTSNRKIFFFESSHDNENDGTCPYSRAAASPSQSG